MTSEILDWLYVIGFFGLVGGGVVGAGFIAVSFIDTWSVRQPEFQERIDCMNATYNIAFVNLSKEFNMYESSFSEAEPFIETQNLTQFLDLCRKWNKTAILYDAFKRRRVAFLGLRSEFSGYFWFAFSDNGITIQARQRYSA